MNIINSGWLPALLASILLLTACTTNSITDDNQISLVSGALSYHIADDKKRDEVNPLGAFEVGKTQCGAYDNSRLKKSNSYYCFYRWLNYAIENTPITLTSKSGGVYYDSQSGYQSSLRSVFSLGVRSYLSKKLWVDLDYMPQSLVGKTDVASLIFGYVIGGTK